VENVRFRLTSSASQAAQAVPGTKSEAHSTVWSRKTGQVFERVAGFSHLLHSKTTMIAVEDHGRVKVRALTRKKTTLFLQFPDIFIDALSTKHQY
jgi:hypothetical protein